MEILPQQQQKKARSFQGHFVKVQFKNTGAFNKILSGEEMEIIRSVLDIWVLCVHGASRWRCQKSIGITSLEQGKDIWTGTLDLRVITLQVEV